MAELVVKATTDRVLGSASARRLRREGRLPGVVYGLGQDPTPVAVDYVELRDTLKGEGGMNTLFSLDIDGAKEPVIVRQVQRDAIRRVVTHADFLRIDPKQTIKVKVPLHITGDDSAVTSQGGLIEQKMFDIEIECLPSAVPQEIVADVSIMTLERALNVGDLVFPEGVASAVAEDISVVAPVIPREIEEETPAEDLVEGEEGVAAEGEAADGDAAEKSESEASE